MIDTGASILAKLKNKAKASGISYQQCLQLFFQEEFLRRLSKSPYTENLVLKGGMFIYTLTNFQSRATIDIDFLLRHIDNNPQRMDSVISEILSTDVGLNDVIILQAKKAEPIALQREYHGISTQITGYIKNVRVPFMIDIGAGDVIVPQAEKRIIQTQLDGFDAPLVYTYSLESTIAEKFDAMLQRFELTGRMKDFYDIHYLSHTFDFEGQKLYEAIILTLQNRGTAYDSESFDRIISLADDNDIQVRWRYFLKTVLQKGLSFTDVMHGITVFLRPVYEVVITGGEFSKIWSAERQVWK
jgi:predicted nucleotidyltransferase component of viral defense system